MDVKLWFGTLLGPEGTPVWWVLSLAAWVLGCPNAFWLGVVVAWGLLWLWVECCIVDASILLWSSC